MKHKTWFRLMMKALGVLLVGMSLADVTYALILILDLLLGALPVPNAPQIIGWPRGSFLQFVPRLLQFAFGLYLFFGGKWIINKAIPSNRRYCPECDYELAQSSGDKCPECGVTLPDRSTP